MILLNDIEKFYSTIMELKESQIQFKLYGNMEETFAGAFAGFEQPPNNTLRIKIVALTGIVKKAVPLFLKVPRPLKLFLHFESYKRFSRLQYK